MVPKMKTPPPSLAWEGNEKALLSTMGWFFNTKITTAEQPYLRWSDALGGPTLQSILDSPRTVDAWREGQTWARELIGRVVGYDNSTAAEKRRLLRDVDALVNAKVKAKVVTAADARTGYEVKVVVVPVNFEGAIAYCAALFLMKEKLRRRVGVCALDGCGRLFVDMRERPGTQQKYCTPAHSAKGRVIAFRQRSPEKSS